MLSILVGLITGLFTLNLSVLGAMTKIFLKHKKQSDQFKRGQIKVISKLTTNVEWLIKELDKKD